MSTRVAPLALSLLFVCGNARAEDPGCKDFRTLMNAGVELGVNGTDWELALRQFERAQKFTCSAADDARLALYRGIVLFNMRRPVPAKDAFRQALLLDPEAKLPGKYGSKIEALFEQVRAETPVVSARPAPPPEPVPPVVPSDGPVITRLTPKAATTSTTSDVVTGPAKPGKSYLLPAVLGGTGLVAAGIGTFFGVQSSQAVQRASRAEFQDDTRAQLATARTDATVANVLFAVAGTALVGGVVALFWPAPAPPGEPR